MRVIISWGNIVVNLKPGGPATLSFHFTEEGLYNFIRGRGVWVYLGKGLQQFSHPYDSTENPRATDNSKNKLQWPLVLFFLLLFSYLCLLRQPFGKLHATHSKVWNPISMSVDFRVPSLWVLRRSQKCATFASHWNHRANAQVYQKSRRGLCTGLWLSEHSHLGRNSQQQEGGDFIHFFLNIRTEQESVSGRCLTGWLSCWKADVLVGFRKGLGWIRKQAFSVGQCFPWFPTFHVFRSL